MTRHLGMQELADVDQFDAIVCIDALENVFPEDWPRILANFARALHARSHVYLTVEIASEEELRTAYAAAHELQLPLVYGEYAHEGYYHYYPTDGQVRA
nr:class I SAM-dependent methyltransferase [Ktedonospora formicarum]